jgi:hypothetical protein
LKYTYYPYSCAQIEQVIRSSFSDIEPVRHRLDYIDRAKIISDPVHRRNMAEYLLWMIEYLQRLTGQNPDLIAKRGRWIGWVYAKLEDMNLVDNQLVHEWSRADSDGRNF